MSGRGMHLIESWPHLPSPRDGPCQDTNHSNQPGQGPSAVQPIFGLPSSGIHCTGWLGLAVQSREETEPYHIVHTTYLNILIYVLEQSYVLNILKIFFGTLRKVFVWVCAPYVCVVDDIGPV